MPIARSRITAHWQVPVPAEVRRLLCLAPGSVLQWEAEDGQIIVRKAGRYTTADLHAAAFPESPPTARSLEELKAGILKQVRPLRRRS